MKSSRLWNFIAQFWNMIGISKYFTRILNPVGFQVATLYAFLISPMRATWPTLLIVLDLIILIIFREEYKVYNLFAASCYFIILLSTPFSNIHNLSFLQYERDVLHRYKTTGTII
jgi:hypothetical protein